MVRIGNWIVPEEVTEASEHAAHNDDEDEEEEDPMPDPKRSVAPSMASPDRPPLAIVPPATTVQLLSEYVVPEEALRSRPRLAPSTDTYAPPIEDLKARKPLPAPASSTPVSHVSLSGPEAPRVHSASVPMPSLYQVPDTQETARSVSSQPRSVREEHEHGVGRIPDSNPDMATYTALSDHTHYGSRQPSSSLLEEDSAYTIPLPPRSARATQILSTLQPNEPVVRKAYRNIVEMYDALGEESSDGVQDALGSDYLTPTAINGQFPNDDAHASHTDDAPPSQRTRPALSQPRDSPAAQSAIAQVNRPTKAPVRQAALALTTYGNGVLANEATQSETDNRMFMVPMYAPQRTGVNSALVYELDKQLGAAPRGTTTGTGTGEDVQKDVNHRPTKRKAR